MAPRKTTKIKGHCPSCGPNINADVKAQYKKEWEHETGGIWGHHLFMILECAGCNTTYFCEESYISDGFDDDGGVSYTFFPNPIKIPEPQWAWELTKFNAELSSLFGDVYKSANVDLNVPSAIACRTVFDKASEVLGIDTELSFAKKLDQLVSLSYLGLAERGHLDALTDAGGAAVHRGWKPSDEQLYILIDVLEAFVYRCFIANVKVAELKKSIPDRKKPATIKRKW